MQKLTSRVMYEKAYPGVVLGVFMNAEGLFLVDSPLRAEDGRDWLGQLSPHGTPSYLALLDHHPDRVLGARVISLPLISHEDTCRTIESWPDTYKGGSRPIGAEADQLKRITGVGKAVPQMTFTDNMLIHLGETEINLEHRPGPMAGSIWVVLPEDKVIFVGDAVTLSEPPYFGEADLEAWLQALDTLRESPYNEYKMLSSRDGIVDREAVNQMARFLRKIPVRLERMKNAEDPQIEAMGLAEELLDGFDLEPSRRSLALVRLQISLLRLCEATYPIDA